MASDNKTVADTLREALGKIRAELWNNTVIAGKKKSALYEIADLALAAPPEPQGDGAKMREALVKIEKMAHCNLCNVYPKYRDLFNSKIGGIEREARAALAALDEKGGGR